MNTPERDWDEPDFKKQPPEPLYKYKEIGPSDPIYLPELSRQRKCTNSFCGIVFLIFMLTWIGYTIYMLVTGEFTKFLHGEDDCGNICGLQNVAVQKENCEPKDYRNYTVLLYGRDNVTAWRKCITANQCPWKVVFQRCFTDEEPSHEEFFYTVVDAVFNGALVYLVMVFTAIGVYLLIYVCLRCSARVVLLTILIGSSAGAGATITVLLYYYISLDETYASRLLTPLGLCIVFLAFALFASALLWGQFSLVCKMYEEAICTIFRSPVLLFLPIMISIFLVVLDGFTFYETVFTLSDLDVKENGWVTKVVYLCILWFSWLWLNAFANGLHCMVIAGTIAMYYFDRKRAAASSAFCTSLIVTFRFHLGTIAIGSFIITILTIGRMLEKTQDSRHRDDDSKSCSCAECILCCFKEIADYLTKKAYIMTAIHGKGLFKSGLRAARLIWHYLFDTLAVDISGFALSHFISLIVIIITMGVGYGTAIAMNVDPGIMYLFLILGLILSGTVTYFYASLLNVSSETVFLCFCEDRLLNDGSRNKPYCAPKSFITFLEEAYEASEPKRKKKHRHFGDETPGTSTRV